MGTPPKARTRRKSPQTKSSDAAESQDADQGTSNPPGYALPKYPTRGKQDEDSDNDIHMGRNYRFPELDRALTAAERQRMRMYLKKSGIHIKPWPVEIEENGKKRWVYPLDERHKQRKFFSLFLLVHVQYSLNEIIYIYYYWYMFSISFLVKRMSLI